MKRGPGILLAVLAVLAVGGLVAVSVKRGKQATGKEVKSEAIELRRIESWVRAPGEIKPARLVEISSNVMGRVEEIRVKEGDRVRRGDLLLRLDDERYRSAAAQIRARLDGAQANLEVARASSDLSRQTLGRKQKLFEEHLISPEELDQSKTQAAIDASRYDAASEELRSLKAALAESEKDLRETVFLAPMDGIVTSLNIERGENVITGTMNNAGTVILTLADLDTMLVESEVDETDVVRLARGQEVKITVDALADTTLSGKVLTIGQSGRRSASNGQTQGISFQVKVRVDRPLAVLRPGMTAEIEVLSGARDSVLAVPIQSLVAYPEPTVARWESRRERGDGAKRVRVGDDIAPADTAGGRAKMVEGFFLDQSGKAQFVRATLGLRGDTHVEVSGKAKPGEKVIVGPYRTLRTLRDGESVKPEKKKPASKEKK